MSTDFRRGFLYGLAANGTTPAEFGRALLRKQAGLGGVAGAGGGLLDGAAGLAVGIPLGLGLAGGTAAYRLMKPNYGPDIPSAKNQELLRQMRLATRRVDRRLGPPPADPMAV